MRIIMGFNVAAMLAALLAPSFALAQAHGPGGFGPGGFGPGPGFAPPRQGVGVNAYAPGQGPVGVGAWNGGNWNGYVKGGLLPWGGGYYGSAPSGAEAAGGNVANVFTYNHFDNRRRDGGFYGGGVFYGDDGYSRLPVQTEKDAGCVEGASASSTAGARHGSPYVIELPERAEQPSIVKKRAQVGARH